ncbi:MFS transporter [Streptomyces antibioticus]|uniref:MFS transporter n=1 Tax=Streptomyces antibioticus TaxID=1890 RepID=UPI003686F7C1
MPAVTAVRRAIIRPQAPPLREPPTARTWSVTSFALPRLLPQAVLPQGRSRVHHGRFPGPVAAVQRRARRHAHRERAGTGPRRGGFRHRPDPVGRPVHNSPPGGGSSGRDSAFPDRHPAAHGPARDGTTGARTARRPDVFPLHNRGLQVMMLTFLLTGAVFGSLELATVAYTEALGHASSSGWVLALMALGSAISGLAFGAVAVKARPTTQFPIGVAATAALILPLLLADGLRSLAPLMFVAGTATAPTMITRAAP